MKNLGLLSWLSKRKLTDEQVANIFVNTSFETVELGWPQVASLLNVMPEFETAPNLDPEDYGRFLLIVVAANLSHVPKHFENGVDRAIINRCCAKFGLALGVPKDQFINKVKEFRIFMKKVNHPSKNTTTAMTRAVLYKYNLIDLQDNYFSDMNVPNPIIQKSLRDVMVNFIWDWDEISDNYRVGITEEEEVAAI
jgi:hypothetical protein